MQTLNYDELEIIGGGRMIVLGNFLLCCWPVRLPFDYSLELPPPSEVFEPLYEFLR